MCRFPRGPFGTMILPAVALVARYVRSEASGRKNGEKRTGMDLRTQWIGRGNQGAQLCVFNSLETAEEARFKEGRHSLMSPFLSCFFEKLSILFFF